MRENTFYIFNFLIFGIFNSHIPFKMLSRTSSVEYLKWLTILELFVRCPATKLIKRRHLHGDLHVLN